MDYKLFALILLGLLFQGCNKTTGPETNIPHIVLRGINPDTVVQFSASLYADPGCTAFDNYGSELSITSSGFVDINNAGVYTIVYSATAENGNSRSLERQVIVDGANYLVGDYYAEDFTGSYSNGFYSESIIKSSISFNRISFARFANYVNAGVYGLTNNQTITIPEQTIYCGNPQLARTFTGTGSYTDSSNTYTIYYSVTTDSIVRNGHFILNRI